LFWIVASILPNISAGPQLYADTIAYHVISGNLSKSLATSPNHTVGRTYLDDPNVVALEGDKSQVLVWTQYINDSKIHILNQEYVPVLFVIAP
jgi:hypothetical protein